MREMNGPSDTATGPPVPPATAEAPPAEATYVPVPPPPITPRPLGRQAASHRRDAQWVLVAIASVILVLIVAAGCFAIGFAVGKRNSRSAGLAGQGQQGQAQQRLQQQLEKTGASLLQGQVASVTDNSLTIDTAEGPKTVSITPSTRFGGAGQAASGAGAQGAQSITSGESVFVVVKEAADGKLEAIAVRLRAAGAQPAQPAPPAPQQQ